MDFGKVIYGLLKERNRVEKESLFKIVNSNSKLLTEVLTLKTKCKELERNEGDLRLENVSLRQKKTTSVASEEQLQQHIKIQEELTGLLRERGEKNQEIIDLKNKLQECEKQLGEKDSV
ncbi:hypothetical protein EB796_019188 [Bugula neritina]|uniref:Autophagy-related protein 16 domain-containing protein n=1 Tax=Bugula neritina TaxID=10212 RepID=A0A7J7J9V4_BUGNE|nr:hypothetical protein EB796_019188 [Bugula neritina]